MLSTSSSALTSVSPASFHLDVSRSSTLERTPAQPIHLSSIKSFKTTLKPEFSLVNFMRSFSSKEKMGGGGRREEANAANVHLLIFKKKSVMVLCACVCVRENWTILRSLFGGQFPARARHFSREWETEMKRTIFDPRYSLSNWRQPVVAVRPLRQTSLRIHIHGQVLALCFRLLFSPSIAVNVFPERLYDLRGWLGTKNKLFTYSRYNHSLIAPLDLTI